MPKKNTDSESALFPVLPPSLTGLARQASEAERADAGHLVEFRTMQVRSMLNRSISKRLKWLAYSINPYRGCEFGCRYCYARYTHEFLAPATVMPPEREPATRVNNGLTDSEVGPTNFRDPEAFERIIFLKQNAAWRLEQDLKRVDPAKEIALGTATDPYQPIERRVGITRSLLEVFARKRGYRLGIVTKSTLIERDIDLLSKIGQRNTLVVHVTTTTSDADLVRKLEPRAPRPDLRFQTVGRLRDAGITTGVLCCPLLPGITDSERMIDGMAKKAAEVGANFFAGNPLFLKPCSRPTYLSFVREHFPSLVKDYEKRYGSADFVTTAYSRQLARIVQRACIRYGLRQRSHDALLTRDGALELSFSTQSPDAALRIGPVRAAEGLQQRLFA